MKTYTTERGIEVRIVPIPLLLEQIQDRHHEANPIEVPTYTEQTASGNEREVKMVAADMEAAKVHNPDWYAQHAEAWEAYQVKEAASQAELNDKLLNAVILKAVQVEIPEDDAWIEEQRFLGLEVPESPTQRRLHYVKTEVIGGAKDVVAMMGRAMGGEISEEVLARAEGSFQDFIQGNLNRGLDDQIGAVDGEPEIDAAPGGG